MTVRDHEIQARHFEYEETRRKLKDLQDLRQHIESSLERLASSPLAGGNGANGSAQSRRTTLQASLDDIDQQMRETEIALQAALTFLEESENVRDGYDRVPVAIGKSRGRGQVEHIRIVRAQRG